MIVGRTIVVSAARIGVALELTELLFDTLGSAKNGFSVVHLDSLLLKKF